MKQTYNVTIYERDHEGILRNGRTYTVDAEHPGEAKYLALLEATRGKRSWDRYKVEIFDPPPEPTP
jgi:hypothetical protein